MSRPIRMTRPGEVYHVISRFTAKEWFIEGDEERRAYLKLFGDALQKSDWRSCSFAIMSSHVHHGLVAGRDPLGPWIRDAHSPFGEWINRRRGRIGAVFARGPLSVEVPDSRVASLFAYIHNNPVRAGVAASAKLAAWTSHPTYLGLAKPPSWLDVRLGLERSGFESVSSFDEWVSSKPEERLEPDGRERGEDVIERVVTLLCRELSLNRAALVADNTAAATAGRRALVRASLELGAKVSEAARALELSTGAICRLRDHDDLLVRELSATAFRAIAREDAVRYQGKLATRLADVDRLRQLRTA